MRLTDDYQYESEEEEKQQTSRKPDKKELPKKPIKDDLRKFNEWVDEKETDINRELFKMRFDFQKSGDMLKTVYDTNNKKKISNLVNWMK